MICELQCEVDGKYLTVGGKIAGCAWAHFDRAEESFSFTQNRENWVLLEKTYGLAKKIAFSYSFGFSI